MSPSAQPFHNRFQTLELDVSTPVVDTPTPVRVTRSMIQPSTRSSSMTGIIPNAPDLKRKAEEEVVASNKKANQLDGPPTGDGLDSVEMDVDAVALGADPTSPIEGEAESVGQFAPLSPCPKLLELDELDTAVANQSEARSASSPPTNDRNDDQPKATLKGKIRPSFASIASGKAKLQPTLAAPTAQQAQPRRTFLAEPATSWPTHHVTEVHLLKDLTDHSRSLMCKDMGPAVYCLFGNDGHLRVEQHAQRIDFIKEALMQSLGRRELGVKFIAPVVKSDIDQRVKPVLPYKVTGLSEQDVLMLESVRVLNCSDFWLLLVPSSVPITDFAFALDNVPLSDTEDNRAEVRAIMQEAISSIPGIKGHLNIKSDNFSDDVEPEDRLDALLDTVVTVPQTSGDGSKTKWKVYLAPPSSDAKLHTLLIDSICNRPVAVCGIPAVFIRHPFSCNACKGEDHTSGQCPFKLISGFHDSHVGQLQTTTASSSSPASTLGAEDSPLFAQTNTMQAQPIPGPSNELGLEHSRYAPQERFSGPLDSQQWKGPSFAPARRGNGGRGGRGGQRGRNF
ncbi:hypothetical protein BKA70DRAFT_1421062 [Coprinopsis sp. MPI-PUGE-AT-0042]|nr:hypothetical protein BKA70DRAFT_1421062 [Coprinopsis sp. MPI-PUGE-AT-0042]